MQGRGAKPEPLEGHPRYEKVLHYKPSNSCCLSTDLRSVSMQSWALDRGSRWLCCFMAQIRDLNSGTFGFVQLARDKQTGEYIACKFIERGEKVRTC